MSEFLKRWSSRKSEARKHQVLQPREEVIPEAVAAPVEGSGEAEISDTALGSPVVSTDKGSCDPLAIAGAESGESPLITAQPGKAKLPDKEALRAMFRSQQAGRARRLHPGFQPARIAACGPDRRAAQLAGGSGNRPGERIGQPGQRIRQTGGGCQRTCRRRAG